ncbi:polysaccharide deacetylase family protein [Thermodesulfobacteriota bacterium]
MRIPCIGGIHQGVRRISHIFQARALILIYHRVAEFHPDPQLLCVTPAHFEEHLEHLCRDYHPISLQALRQALAQKCLPQKAVVVTFDDGYIDNLLNAKPLLEKHEVPATVFVTAGYPGRDRELPSDMLEHCLLQARILPDSLTLDIEGKTYCWQIDDFKHFDGAWNVTMKIDPSLRHRCYRELHRLLQPLDYAKRHAVLETLANWASCPANARPDRRVLNNGEIRELNNSSLVEIGSHGMSHLVLAAQTDKMQWKEIYESKQQLEDISGKPVSSFSYPYGGMGDVSRRTIEMVKDAGFEIACANIPGTIIRQSDQFFLPRYLVRDWNGVEFANRIRVAFNG